MYGPYHLKAMIDQRHDEAQREAQTRRLAKQARTATNWRGSRRVGPAWSSVDRRAPVALSLALLALVVILAASGCGDAPPDLADTEDTYQEDTYEEDTHRGDTHREDTYQEDTNQEYAYGEYAYGEYAYQDQPEPTTVGPPEPTVAMRVAGDRNASLECYTFYSDDSVELRHHGEPTVNDQGSLLETGQGGMEIVWESGRAASTVASQAGVLIVDGTEFTPVDTCNESSDDASSDTDTASYGGTSSECYTFYSDGTVEFSQGGAQAPSDSGTYQGLGVFGEIIWDSERPTSQVVPIGASNTYTAVPQADALIVDDVEFARVGSCY